MRRLSRYIIFSATVAALALYAGSKHDIVATTLAIAGGVLWLYITTLTVIQNFKLSPPQLDILVIPNETGRVLSRTALTARITLANITPVPSFFATIQMIWEQDGVELKPIVMKGRAYGDTFDVPIHFPHRGEWRCKEVVVNYRDPLRIVNIASSAQLSCTITVYPRGDEIQNLPTFSSASRPGDSAPASELRTGDLFEMKQYDPAQGMRRILWRVFAKRGELMSRAPEAAVTPEGFTACFAILNELDDDLATKAIDYTARLESAGLTLAFSCTGNVAGTVTRAGEVERATIASVWGPKATIVTSELNELVNASKAFGEVTQVVIFISTRNFNQNSERIFAAQLDLLASLTIRPIVALELPKDASPEETRSFITSLSSRVQEVFEI